MSTRNEQKSLRKSIVWTKNASFYTRNAVDILLQLNATSSEHVFNRRSTKEHHSSCCHLPSSLEMIIITRAEKRVLGWTVNEVVIIIVALTRTEYKILWTKRCVLRCSKSNVSVDCQELLLRDSLLLASKIEPTLMSDSWLVHYCVWHEILQSS